MAEEVSNLGAFINDNQFAKAFMKLITFTVFVNYTSIRLLHPLNMLDIFVTLTVSIFATFLRE